jgi:RHS repeat-associated protein
VRSTEIFWGKVYNPIVSRRAIADYHTSDAVSAQDYYPFGMVMPKRTYSAGKDYRYGFNGKEKDPDLASSNYDFGSRIYDGRIARWLSIDPMQKKYAPFTPYNFVENNPNIYRDVDGKDKWLVITVTNEMTGIRNTISVKISNELLMVSKGMSADGQGHGNSGRRYYHDININFNITVGSDGKVNTAYSETAGTLRTSITRGPNEVDDEKRARQWIKIEDFFDVSNPAKEADIGSGFFLTSSTAKEGSSDPYGPGAKKVDIIKDADAFLAMIGGGVTLAEGTPLLRNELKDMPKEVRARLLEAFVKGFEIKQRADQLKNMIEDKIEDKKAKARGEIQKFKPNTIVNFGPGDNRKATNKIGEFDCCPAGEATDTLNSAKKKKD